MNRRPYQGGAVTRGCVGILRALQVMVGWCVNVARNIALSVILLHESTPYQGAVTRVCIGILRSLHNTVD